MTDLRHLFVDARSLDHPLTRQRGIGRYTAGLLSGLAEIGAPVTALYETDAERQMLVDLAPGIRSAAWHPDVVRDAPPDTWYLATMLMVSPVRLDPVPRIVTDAGLNVAAVMYDVIPQRYPERYQQRAEARALLRLRAVLTRTLDALLAISEFSATTAAEALGFPRDRIRTIGAGVQTAFRVVDNEPWARLRRLGLSDDHALVVSVSSWDERKNTERLMLAWAEVPVAVRQRHRLVIVGAHDDELRAQWQRWAVTAGVDTEVRYTGAVSDEEMVALHQVAALAVMPSTDEGFGLPVLEAATCGCPVITSSTSALPELLADAAAEFDPFDTGSMARAIARALTDGQHRAHLQRLAADAAERWTWPATARAAVDGLGSLPQHGRERRSPIRRLALVGRSESAVALALRRSPGAPSVIEFTDGGPSSASQSARFERFPLRAFGRYLPASQFDHVLAVIDDSSPALSQIIGREQAHVWIRGANPAANAAIARSARSVIVDDDDAAAQLRPHIDPTTTVLVLPPISPVGDVTALAAALLDHLVNR